MAQDGVCTTLCVRQTSGHRGFIPNSQSGKSLITYYLSTTKVVLFLMACRHAQGIMVIPTEHINCLKEGFIFFFNKLG